MTPPSIDKKYSVHLAKHKIFYRNKKKSRYGLWRKSLIIQELNRSGEVNIMNQKYWIPKSLLYRILNEDKQGKISKFKDNLAFQRACL